LHPRMQPFRVPRLLICEINVEFTERTVNVMDKQFFTQEVKQAERSLYRIARSYLPTDADAADAVQEALVRAWTHRDTLREPKYFHTWLTRIVINACKDELKKRRRAHTAAAMPGLAENAPTETGDELRGMLEALGPRYRVPLALFYLDGYTIGEISKLLTLPQGTVKNRLFRAKQKLRTYYQNEEVFEDET
jgi:RNA polymerase sigma-70 factor, ECF subfamily